MENRWLTFVMGSQNVRMGVTKETFVEVQVCAQKPITVNMGADQLLLGHYAIVPLERNFMGMNVSVRKEYNS